jgi:hypothetical protein
MANAKKRTTFAKLNREAKLRDKRIEKQARKDARKLEAAAAAQRPGEQPEQHEEPAA